MNELTEHGVLLMANLAGAVGKSGKFSLLPYDAGNVTFFPDLLSYRHPPVPNTALKASDDAV